MPTVHRTARADEDLIEIWLHIATVDPEAADRVLDAIERRWQQLAQHPLSGMPRHDIAAGIRHLVAGQYLTLYRVHAEGVEIVRILHGRREINPDAVEP
ncbi:type II toxin-antitoxin system RelE/ParE family toxin [Methylobrevis albus]|uniref:type II toxin-antitoxin system RelE/ParE family toxin n=1 Tax=Methylobrevis albus TaxID=2793297 RepID=UPI002E2CB458|nr:type II toxin-antitoxin system RelE/ParE family toxin [Methylobrevis albus]